MVIAAGVLGLAALLTVGILAVVTIVGIPFAIGLLGIALPGLFVIGYIVTGIWLGELILAQSSPAARERPYLAAVVGLTIVGLISFLPLIGGLISFVGFGAVMLLSWRVLRGAPGAVPAAAGNASVAQRSELIARRHPAERPSSNGGRRRVGRSGPCAGRPPGAGARPGLGSRIDG